MLNKYKVFTGIKAQGSALLLALLMLVTVSSFTLFILRVTLVANRAYNNAEDTERALSMAKAGLQEGYILSGGDKPEVDNQYEGYGRRGFVKGTNCSTISQRGLTTLADIDRDCPRYDFSVRRSTTYTSTTPAVISKRDMSFAGPASSGSDISEVTLTINGSYAQFILEAESDSFTSDNNKCSGGTNPLNVSNPREGLSLNNRVFCQVGLKPTGAPVIIYSLASDISTDSIQLYLRCNSVCNNVPVTLQMVFSNYIASKNPKLIVRAYGAFNIEGPTPTSTSAASTSRIYKGYTTIESIGYSGNVKKKLIMYVRDKDYTLTDPIKGSKEIYEFSREFGNSGCLKNAMTKTTPANPVGNPIKACPNFIERDNKLVEVLQ